MWGCGWPPSSWAVSCFQKDVGSGCRLLTCLDRGLRADGGGGGMRSRGPSSLTGASPWVLQPVSTDGALNRGRIATRVAGGRPEMWQVHTDHPGWVFSVPKWPGARGGPWGSLSFRTWNLVIPANTAIPCFRLATTSNSAFGPPLRDHGWVSSLNYGFSDKVNCPPKFYGPLQEAE